MSSGIEKWTKKREGRIKKIRMNECRQIGVRKGSVHESNQQVSFRQMPRLNKSSVVDFEVGYEG